MRTRGFTLVELSVVLVILGLIGGTLFSISSAMMGVQRGETTRAKLRVIDAALVSFVAINKRLPCPTAGDATTGIEDRTGSPCGASQGKGVVPWVTLGLAAADIEDGWGSRITYRLDPVLALDNGMDMSLCDPAGTGVAQVVASVPTCNTVLGTCISTDLTRCVKPIDFLAGKGLAIQDGAGNPLMSPAANPSTGAAYALFSHGENRSGSYEGSGILLETISLAEGNNEKLNRADNTLYQLAGYYVDAPQQFSQDTTRFDDFVLRPSIISVIQRASLGPRSH